MSEILPLNIATTYVALDDKHKAWPLPVTDDFWADLMSGQLGQFSRLVSLLSHDRDWATWEMHPAGEELVCLLEGHVVLHLELPDGLAEVELCEDGQFVLVPANTWHTAKVRQPSRMLFITPGEGTQNRPI